VTSLAIVGRERRSVFEKLGARRPQKLCFRDSRSETDKRQMGQVSLDEFTNAMHPECKRVVRGFAMASGWWHP